MTFEELKDDIDFLVHTDATQYAVADKTRNINRHFANVVSIILSSDNKWKWDDSNQADHPILYINLISGTPDYEISDATYLKIQSVDILNTDGKRRVLTPIDRTEDTAQSLNYLEEGNDGMPRYYDKLGDSLFLYPAPSSSHVTLTSGMRIHYQRGASYFVTTDTTKTPGFAEPYHRILSVGAALDYATANGMTQKIQVLSSMLAELMTQLREYYSSRNNDEQPRMRLRKENYGQDCGRSGYRDTQAF